MSSSNPYHEFHETGSSNGTGYVHGLYPPTSGQWREGRTDPSAYGPAFPNEAYAFDPNPNSFGHPGPALSADHNFVGLEVLRCFPLQGWAGTNIHVSARCRLPIDQTRTKLLAMVPGSRSEGSYQSEGSGGQQQYYRGSVPAPRLARVPTEGHLDVPLTIQLEDTNGQTLASAEVGYFRYLQVGHGSCGGQQQPETSRKRRMSANSPMSQTPVKKTSAQQLQPLNSRELSRRTSSALGSESANEAVPSPGPSSAASSAFGGQPFPPQGHATPASLSQLGQRGTHDSSTSSAAPADEATSPRIKSGAYPSGGQPPSTAADEGSTMHALPETSAPSRGGSNPPLVRTSTVPNSVLRQLFEPLAPGDMPGGAYPAFHETKASLDIQGDLDGTAFGWTEEERRAQRRLVEFSRSQDGNHVSTTFKPVAPEDRAPNSICVSCIWWEERGEAFVTSVDAIQLLESLVAVRFTVEEKNRIRRNLEGFRPQTVAKGKSDSERFFKTIMDFPNPKPRNIEKDVKVFPWRVLKHALKKIIGKYSASYTTGPIQIPTSATGPHSAGPVPYETYHTGPSASDREASSGMALPVRQGQYFPGTSPGERGPIPQNPRRMPVYPAAMAPHPPMPVVYCAPPQQTPTSYGVNPMYAATPEQGWTRGGHTGDTLTSYPQAHHEQAMPMWQQYGTYGYQAGPADQRSMSGPSTPMAPASQLGQADASRSGRQAPYPMATQYPMQYGRYPYGGHAGPQSTQP